MIHEIEALFHVILANPAADDEDLLAGLMQAGVGRRSAMRIVVLVPSAFGRDQAARLGARLDDHINIRPDMGPKTTTRRLDSFPEFRVAKQLIPRFRESNVYMPLVNHSAEGNAIRHGPESGMKDYSKVTLTAVLTGWDIIDGKPPA